MNAMTLTRRTLLKGGLTLGADPVATAVLHTPEAQATGVNAFVVRKAVKEHSMQRRI